MTPIHPGGKLLSSEQSVRLTVVKSAERQALLEHIVRHLQIRERANSRRGKRRKAVTECQNSYCVLLGDHAECMTEDVVMTKVNPTFGGPEQ